MRTLKKSLALVLALVMVLGLGVVGASADNKLDDYNDLDKLDAQYEEAAGVLTGLGIVAGIDSVTLDPDGYYTREQAAKIITYMIMGADKAEKLSCTKAPFDDVAADHWSAKYISYCAEAGIIDGVGGNKFDPYSKLTGYQWAKMLLCAVGFGANGEFTGDSWSLGTATVAAQTDLFAGDLEGGDHVALRREQAMLYAFNTLAYIRQVTYTSNGNNYVYDIEGYEWADGTGQTLGQDVYGLKNAQGIITRVEGQGYPTTVVAANYNVTTGSAIYAGNDIDMLYHAARVWYTGANNGVYTYDLAKSTVYGCTDVTSAPATTNGTKTVGNTREGELYERAYVDNTAVNMGTVWVDYYYEYSTMGTKHVNGFDIWNEADRIDYDRVWTNIDSIGRGDGILYLATTPSGVTGTYHIYAVQATSGTVSKVDNTVAGKTITLTDGTELDASVFANTANLETDPVIGGTYNFVLDTHGHYISWTPVVSVKVGYYTGTWRNTTAHDAWSASYAYAGQFVDVTTGTPYEAPVTENWKTVATPGYYDTTTANPVRLDYTDNQYADTYVFRNGAVTFDAVNHKFTVNGTSKEVYYDPDTVTFIIATGVGDTLDTQTYYGVADLLSDYASSDGTTSISMYNLAVTCVTTGGSEDYSASVIFAFPQSTQGGIIYFPTTVTTNMWVRSANGWEYTGGYLNGTKTQPTVIYANKPTQDIAAGFYTFSIDTANHYTLIPLNTSVTTNGTNLVKIGGDKAWIEVGGEDRLVSDEGTVVIDLRDPTEEFLCDSVADLLVGDNNHFYAENLKLAMTWTGRNIDVIYVIGDYYHD